MPIKFRSQFAEILVAVALTLLLQLSVSGQSNGISATDKTERVEIAPGLTHTSLVRKTSEGQWSIHYLVIDVTRNSLRISRAMDEIIGSETTSSIALRHGALAAVNGGYFRVGGTYRGEPVGTYITGREVKSEPNGVRPSMAIDVTGTKVALVNVVVELWLESSNHRKVEVSGVDRPREASEAIIYTADFHRTTLTNPDGLEILVRKGRVTAISKGGSSAIPADGFVYSVSGRLIDGVTGIKPGDRLTLHQRIVYSPNLEWEPASVLGAGPILIREGRIEERFDGFPESFLKTRHPRTAIGVQTNGAVVLLTVDGRQPGKSDGASIYELQKLMTELGCVNAMNLDGGGSTTMVVKGKVVNSVSDATGERPVSDAILVIQRIPPK